MTNLDIARFQRQTVSDTFSMFHNTLITDAIRTRAQHLAEIVNHIFYQQYF